MPEPQANNNWTSSDADVLQIAGEVASLLLIDKGDTYIDLSKTSSAHRLLSKYLKQAFAAPLQTALSAALQDQSQFAALGVILVDRMAELQADMFVLKSVLLGQEKFIVPESQKYKDPIAFVQSLIQSQTLTNPIRATSLSVPLDRSVLGSGWHDVEARGDGTVFRWSGPATRCTLLLPSFGPGRHRISGRFDIQERQQLQPDKVWVNGFPAENFDLSWESELSGILSFEAVLLEGALSSFLFLELEVAYTKSPAELGQSVDQRLLGIGLQTLSVCFVE